VLAVDTNILVYAHRREASVHAAAAGVVRGLAEGADPWAIAWPCVYEFLSVVTSPRIWKQACSTPTQAWAQVTSWLGSPTLRLLGETEDFAAVLARFVALPRVRGPIVHDARVAALCVAHGVESLLTRDRDFGLFAELRTRDPLA
jgi:toxin-antitoxin system PIN domain toxin